MSVRVFVGLGSNLADPKKQLQIATRALDKIPATELKTVSSIYVSSPMGPADQADYLNAVAELETALGAEKLLDHLQSIENEMGRTRDGRRWQARVIDLDILLYGKDEIDSDRLLVPHPGMHERAFVLYPLHEIDEEITIPGKGQVAALLHTNLEGEVLKKLEEKLCL